MYTWCILVGDRTEITSMKFYQWSTEASYGPFVFLIISSLGTYDHVVFLCRSFTIVSILIEIPVFLLMRYAEMENNLFLNDIKAHVFHILC